MVLSKRTAFITGITGQTGAYLAELLLSKGYRVHGLVRWDAVDGTKRLQDLEVTNERLSLHYGDLTDANNLTFLMKTIMPDEIYNLAALSQVKVSFETPSSTLDINAKGALNIYETVRILGWQDRVKIYQASSSEMFGASPAPQNEETPFAPCSPYGVAKLAAYWLGRTYRDSYGMFICNGILFNHESPLRGEDFVTQKIVKAVTGIEAGRQDKLVLGNLDSARDWGHAKDYVDGIWRMMQQETSDDFVLATGEAHSVREFVERAFAQCGFELRWEGEGLDEKGIDVASGKELVSVDPVFYRPKEVNYLLGDAGKAAKVLGWKPAVFFDDLVSEMVNAARSEYWQDADTWQKTG